MKKLNKYYYQIVAKPICTVFLDDHLMRKANKILYRYRQEMEELLANNTENLIRHEWGLAYPNGEQATFYSSNPVDEYTTLVEPFETRLIKNIYDLEGKSVYDEEVKQEVAHLMELQAELEDK